MHTHNVAVTLKIPSHPLSVLPIALLIIFASPLCPADISQWYPFQPKNDPAAGAIGMADWLDAPAGKHGRVKNDSARYIFEDGTPVKFWGVNLQNLDCAPPKTDGAAWAKWRAKYGVNCVRIFKFMDDGDKGIGSTTDSTKFDPVKADLFDYFMAELKKNGIYYGFQPIYEPEVRYADRLKLLKPDEVAATVNQTGKMLFFIAEDFQDIRIQMFVSLLTRRNPYTGLTYAQDPAVSHLEIINEDSMFCKDFAKFNTLTTFPTYKKNFVIKYSRWLKTKYGTHQNLVNSWGPAAMNVFEEKNENLDLENIMVQGDTFNMLSWKIADTIKLGLLRRMLDNAEFLYDVQRGIYARFVKAFRDAGYQGNVSGGNWLGAPGLTHFLNLLTDSEVGTVDRHVYYAAQHALPSVGTFDSSSQLDNPGIGILLKGMEQVNNRPFALTEWNTGFPNEWYLESTALTAAYGMGLQGWDASFQFSSALYSASVMYSTTVNTPQWFNCDFPTQVGIYPALARMIYRGDIKEGPVVGNLKVSLAELLNNKPDWLAQMKKGVTDDDGNFTVTGLIPATAGAVGKSVVEYVNLPAASVVPNMANYTVGDSIRSATGELVWYNATGKTNGYFTINTEGTKAAVGFLPNTSIVLGSVTIKPQPGFGGIFITSREKNTTIATSKSLLLTAIGRMRNTGMVFNADGTALLTMGKSPILLEPVSAQIIINGATSAKVWALDHDGIRTAQTLPISNGTFTFDGAATRTFYYEVEINEPLHITPVVTVAPEDGITNEAFTAALDVDKNWGYWRTNTSQPYALITTEGTNIIITRPNDGTVTLWYYGMSNGISSATNSRTYTFDMTEPMVSGAPASFTTNKPFTVSLAVDEDYGYWSTNNFATKTQFTAAGTAITISGTCTLKYYGRDMLGNNSVTNTRMYTLDTAAPAVSGAPASFTTNKPFAVSLAVNEDYGYWTTNNFVTKTPFTAAGTTITIDATRTLQYYGRDALGNNSVTNTRIYTFDIAAPMVSGAPATMATNDVFDVTLSVNENFGYWSTNGTTYQQFSTTGIEIPIERTTTLRYFGRDVLGNTGTTNTRTYTVVTTGAIVTGAPGSFTTNKPFTVTLDVNENYGYWTTNNWTTKNKFATAGTDITFNATATLRFYGSNVSGIKSGESVRTYTFDTAPPVVGGAPDNLSTNDAFTVSLNVNESYGYWSTNDAAFVQCTAGGVEIPIEQTTTLRYFGRDMLGNTGTTNTRTYTVVTTTIVTPVAPTNMSIREIGMDDAAALRIAWTDLPDEENYRVFRSTNGSTYGFLKTVIGDMTEYTDTNIKTGVMYWYRVSATNEAGESARSTAVSNRAALRLAMSNGTYAIDASAKTVAVDFKLSKNTFQSAAMRYAYRVTGTEPWTDIPSSRLTGPVTCSLSGAYSAVWAVPDADMRTRYEIRVSAGIDSVDASFILGGISLRGVGKYVIDDACVLNSPYRGSGGITIMNLPKDARAEIYTISGRLIARLPEVANGADALVWDVRTSGGAAASPGVYLCRLVAGGEMRILRLIVSR